MSHQYTGLCDHVIKNTCEYCHSAKLNELSVSKVFRAYLPFSMWNS